MDPGYNIIPVAVDAQNMKPSIEKIITLMTADQQTSVRTNLAAMLKNLRPAIQAKLGFNAGEMNAVASRLMLTILDDYFQSTVKFF